jgi:uncharacterized protein YbcV (DUF1398 family)
MMDEATRRIVTDVTRDSDEERSTFPEVVGRLIAAGVERYHMDMVRSERVFYMPDGTSESVSTDKYPPAAQSFLAKEVDAAVRAIQGGEIQYLEFCRRITQAGCVGYHVFIAGKRVVYYGRTGEQHVEYFPGAKP